jgi:hypothetical protein
MAKRQVVSYTYTCDVCGVTIPDADSDTATRKVSWEGTDYVVDLCVTHGSQLGDVLTQLRGFVDSGNRESGRRGRRSGSATAASGASKAPRGRRATGASSAAGGPKRADLGAVRAWARANGMKVSERGRIPAALLSAYDSAASAPAAPAAPASAPAKAARKRGPRKKATA